MNWLDIVIILVVLFGTFVGARTGIVRAIATLIGLGLGTYLAGQYYKGVASVLSQFITSDSLARATAFILVLVVVFLAVWFLGLMLRKILRVVLLSWLDGLLGALLGFVAGAALCGLFVIVIASFGGEALEKSVEDSLIAPVILERVPLLLGLLPKEFDAVRRLFQR